MSGALITASFGYVTLHETIRVEGGAFVIGGFARFYDAHGNLLRETAPADYVQLAA